MTIQWDELRAAYDAWRTERDKYDRWMTKIAAGEPYDKAEVCTLLKLAQKRLAESSA